MRILSRALGLGALLMAAPLAATSAAGAASAQPYHQTGDAGHLRLQPAGWSGGDDRRRPWGVPGPHWTPARPWNAPWAGRGHGWGEQHWHGGRPAYLAPRPLPGRVVEHRLRQQSFRPIGQIVLRRGVYLVPALDPRGRRVLLVVDPATAVILGRQRRR
jgi:hypothetical protein